jgi:cell division protein FtsQ
MKIYQRFTKELDSRGTRISDSLDEVDLSSPEDVKALIPDDGAAGGKGEVLVHFGDSDFLERYDRYKAHLAEWRAQYPRLAAVDMRYERQVVLEMQPGSGAAAGGDAAAVKADAGKAAAAKSAAVASPVGSAQAAAPITAAATKAAAAATSKAASTVEGKAGSPIGGAGSSSEPVAAKASSGPDGVHHLTVAKAVPVAKQAGAKKSGAKKSGAKAKHSAKKAVVNKYHPPAVVQP